ncbi:MAG TPA: GNAT family N-acetyltransferase [Gemmatimonadaceae bacterium]|jgi:GNAT superfamily N-acetyltransferase|nr:GNAT family N-acetyltransferase [Gemmatimonadaceae bacterium]
MQQPPIEARAIGNSQSTTVQIRRALPRDADALAQLRYAFRLERRPATESRDAFAARCSNWMRPRLRGDSRWTVWLAERDGTIVGNLWVQIVEKIPNPGPESELHAYISNFFIVPEARNSGLGTRILSAAVAHCKAHGVDTVFLWPSERSVPLYSRTGFEVASDLLVLELREAKSP